MNPGAAESGEESLTATDDEVEAFVVVSLSDDGVRVSESNDRLFMSVVFTKSIKPLLLALRLKTLGANLGDAFFSLVTGPSSISEKRVASGNL